MGNNNRSANFHLESLILCLKQTFCTFCLYDIVYQCPNHSIPASLPILESSWRQVPCLQYRMPCWTGFSFSTVFADLIKLTSLWPSLAIFVLNVPSFLTVVMATGIVMWLERLETILSNGTGALEEETWLVSKNGKSTAYLSLEA